MNQTTKLEREAIKVIKLAAIAADAKGERLELAYSGGKDSEIMRCLALLAGVDCDLVYKQTTIDHPGTTAFVLSKGARVLHPEHTLLSRMKYHGWPSLWIRWCCEEFKEYMTPGYSVTLIGVRRAESKQRAERYTSFNQCRPYPHNQTNEQFFPLLNWTKFDEVLFTRYHNVQHHPAYYDEHGNFCPNRRLGCVGCPLAGDRGKSDFIKFPKFFYQWCKMLIVWFANNNGATRERFPTAYHVAFYRLFCRDMDDYNRKLHDPHYGGDGLLYMQGPQAFLESYFHTSLPAIEDTQV